jgi:hypothetical protein
MIDEVSNHRLLPVFETLERTRDAPYANAGAWVLVVMKTAL